MNAVDGMLFGLQVAFQWDNLVACFIGVLVGTLVGVLPGIGPVGAMALLLPLTFTLTPTAALIMLAGIYYGSMYGGSTTSILLRIPGCVASMVATLDGYEMAKRGRAGSALFLTTIASFIAGTVGIVGLAFVGPALANAALHFGPPEFFALCVVGLMVLSRLTGSSLPRSLVMVSAGLMIATIGMEPMSGSSRFTFGNINLSQGINLVPVAMGMFGVAELLVMIEERLKRSKPIAVRFRELMPSREEWRRSRAPIARGSALGFVLGLVPGPAALISAFSSYALERRLSKNPEEFGKGAVEGVSGPEAANNAAAQASFVPLLSLGIPFAPATAVLLAALLVHGVQTGPLLMTKHPDIFWGVVSSMYVGNFMLLILNLPLIGLFVSLLRLPMHYLASVVALLCLVGTYAIANSMLDMWVLVISGAVGYLLRKLDFEPAVLVLGLALAPVLERSFLQSLYLVNGEVTQIFARPLTATMLCVGCLVMALPMVLRLLRPRGSAAAVTGTPS
jgi:putative tricarboxylic transport membrane protein